MGARGRAEKAGAVLEGPDWTGKRTRADRMIAFLEGLPVPGGMLAGQQMTVYPWQRRILRGMYAPGVREAVVSIPRKNGKTGLAAGLALGHLCGPEAEEMGEVYSAATDKKQAGIVFRQCKAMIRRTPWLKSRLVIKDFDMSIEDRVTGSTYQALSADAGTKHGLSASCVIYDELAQAPTSELYDVLRTSTGARANPMFISISTQAARDEHVLSELIDYGLAVQEGSIEDATFYLSLYTAPEGADPFDEEVWAACNPGLGVIRSIDEMRTMAKRARRIPSRLPAFLNLYLNQRVQSAASFMAVAEWNACFDGAVSVEALQGRPCVVGLDLSEVRDLTAMVAYFPQDGAVLGWTWAPRETVIGNESLPYEAWIAEGWLEVTPGRAIDKRYVVRRLGELAGQFDVQAVVYDRWGMEEIRRLLDEVGLFLELVPFGQTYADMSPAVAALEAGVISRSLRHGGNPVLAWTWGNLVVDTDGAGHRKFTKGKATAKIDPMIALTMALGYAVRNELDAEVDFTDFVVSF